MDKVYSLKPGFMCRPGLQPLMMSGDGGWPQWGLVRLRTHFLKQWKQALRAAGRTAPPTATGRRRAPSRSGNFPSLALGQSTVKLLAWDVRVFFIIIILHPKHKINHTYSTWFYATTDHKNFFLPFLFLLCPLWISQNWEITRFPNTSNPRKATIIPNSFNFFALLTTGIVHGVQDKHEHL